MKIFGDFDHDNNNEYETSLKVLDPNIVWNFMSYRAGFLYIASNWLPCADDRIIWRCLQKLLDQQESQVPEKQLEYEALSRQTL